MCTLENEFPNHVDVIVVGTGLTESMVSSSLSITGSSVLQIDKHSFYGSFMTSLRFTDMLKLDEFWSIPAVPTDEVTSDDKEFNLGLLNTSLLKHFSSNFLHFCNFNAIGETFEGFGELKLLRKWTKEDLIRSLNRTDFDVLPRAIFADSPIVNSLIRSDVCRYLEFLSINRLLFFNPSGIENRIFTDTESKISECKMRQRSFDPSSLSSLLVKVPVSRGDVFQTRILSLSQKRMLVGFMELCAMDEQNLSSHADIDCADYLDRPLMNYLQEKRSLDETVSRIVTNCLAFSDTYVTLKDALPRLRRLISSMNRVSPFPLLWPRFGCGELPQSFCRMCAVFSGIYCLGRTISAVYPCEDKDQRRRYRVRLSTGEEVSTSCILIGAEQAPTRWVLPQINRWIARAILVTTGSIYPNAHDCNDITLIPMQLNTQSAKFNEPAFLLETPVENRDGKSYLYIVHLTAVCDTCVNAAELFSTVIDRLYPPSDSESYKSEVLWNCFFTLPDLSDVASHGLANTYGLEDEGFIVAPGSDSSMFIDKCVHNAEKIFNEIIPLIRGGEIQCEPSNAARPGAVLSLKQHWDGIFPPRPPKPEDLVFKDEEEETPSVVNENCVVAVRKDEIDSASQ